MPEMKQLMLSQLFQNAKAAAGCIAFFQEYTANQEYQNALVQFQKMGKSLDVITGWLVQERKILPQEAFFQILSQVGRALENQDYILMSDLLGQMLLPALFSLMNDFYENFSRQELGLLPETERNDGVRSWRIEYNNSGEATLAVREKEKDLYFHSNVNAGLEGWHFARNSVDSEVDEYIVLGLGLGYHVSWLENLGLGAGVTVFEPEKTVIELHEQYGVKIRARVVYDRDFTALADALKKAGRHTRFLVHRPTLCSIRPPWRTFFEDYFWSQNSLVLQKTALERNFRKNNELEFDDVWELAPRIEGKTVVFAAGGPSLDEAAEALKKSTSYDVLVCAGTVYKTLLSWGVVPDYVAITDVSPHMERQICGAEEGKTALVALSTANTAACEGFAGKKYRAFQEGFEPAERAARERGTACFSTGGSVSCFVLDWLLQMKAAKIICLGLDLAYTNGQSHAQGTAFSGPARGVRQVKSVTGQWLETSPNFEIYRKWIEERIAGKMTTLLVNTARGAAICGMTYRPVQEALKEN